MLDDFSPDLHSAEQQTPARHWIPILLSRCDYVSKGVDAVSPHIAGSWFVGLPDIVRDIHAVQPIIASPEPTRLDHPPSAIADDLAEPKARMPERIGTLIFVGMYEGSLELPRHGPTPLVAARGW